MRKETASYTSAQSEGATFTEEAGWLVPQQFGDGEAARQIARQGVALADRSAWGRVTIAGAGSEGLVRRIWNATALPVNRGEAVAAGYVYRLRHDRYFLSTPPGRAADAIIMVEGAVAAADGLITVTDQSHGQAELWLVGPMASTLLGRLCGLDFHPTQFPNLCARESSVAKTKQLIVRRDVGAVHAYALIGARSLGAYLWQTIITAGQGLPFALLGEAPLRQLEAAGS
jgi:heterotetrameric sarcosine oxidase gamma subunit